MQNLHKTLVEELKGQIELGTQAWGRGKYKKANYRNRFSEWLFLPAQNRVRLLALVIVIKRLSKPQQLRKSWTG
jgi:hypothetical protein